MFILSNSSSFIIAILVGIYLLVNSVCIASLFLVALVFYDYARLTVPNHINLCVLYKTDAGLRIYIRIPFEDFEEVGKTN